MTKSDGTTRTRIPQGAGRPRASCHAVGLYKYMPSHWSSDGLEGDLGRGSRPVPAVIPVRTFLARHRTGSSLAVLLIITYICVCVPSNTPHTPVSREFILPASFDRALHKSNPIHLPDPHPKHWPSALRRHDGHRRQARVNLSVQCCSGIHHVQRLPY